jgi:transcriptional regulator with XRE-family HTH domain
MTSTRIAHPVSARSHRPTRHRPGSLASIAAASDITRSHLSRILKGTRRPSLEVAKRLSNTMKITLDQFYERFKKISPN